MNLNRKLNNISIIVCLLLVSVFSSCKNEHSEHGNENHIQDEGNYICTMHCEGDKTYPQPGNCPVCKMKLQLVEEELVQMISPNKQVLSRQSTVKLLSQAEGQILKAQGYIDVDRTRNESVSVRFGGRIEKLYVKYELQYVKKGEKIMELYSPELNTFQEEHLFLLKSNTDIALIEQSRQKLLLLGITNNQILQLEKNGTFTKTISIYSPSDGYVLFNSDTKSSTKVGDSQQTSVNNMSMNEKSSMDKNISSSSSQIREGVYVNKGEILFNVNDLKNVWAIVSVSSEFYSVIQADSQVKIISELHPKKKLSGKILLTEQIFEDKKQRFIRVRIDLPNAKNELKLNSLITTEIPLDANSPDSYRGQIPASAVYRTGLNYFVWVKTGTTPSGTGIFQLRKVVTGSAINGMNTIINGLSVNEEVALHAGYLTDSETFLNDN